MDKAAFILLAAIALPALAGTETTGSGGGVKLVPPPANTGAVAPSEQASTLRDTKKASGKTLRCWQHGRLLFEQSGFKDDAERPANAVVVGRNDGSSVTVFDQKDAVCILSNN
jgi:hypothetical protein